MSIAVPILVASAPASPLGVEPPASAWPPASPRAQAAATPYDDPLEATSVLRSTGRRPTPDAPEVRVDLGRADIPTRDPEPKVVIRRQADLKAVFLGDSYTSGWNGAGIGSRGWPAIVGRTLGWRTANLAVAGTGFMNPGWTSQTIGSRVARAIRQRPDIVVVAGGHNDSRWSAATTARASDEVLGRLRRALPDARFVIIAPIWSNGSPPARCLDLRNHLRRTARSMGAIFVDPLADRWFAGGRQRLIGPDGIHPTDAGHRYIAERVLEAVAAAS